MVYILSMLLPWSWAALNPAAKYYTGTVSVHGAPAQKCHIEIVYLSPATAIDIRVITPMPHLDSTGKVERIAFGPFKAQYVPNRSLYRYRDPAAGALVRDLVVYTTSASTPSKMSALVLHDGHHDPVHCLNLAEPVTPEEVQELSDRFAEFDQLKP